ncbi:MAG: glycosyltransferase [Anaerolineae bacterium]
MPCVDGEAVGLGCLHVYMICGRLDTIGGVEEHLASLSTALVDAGHRVTLFSKCYNSPTNPYLARMIAGGVRYVGPDYRQSEGVEITDRMRTRAVGALSTAGVLLTWPLASIDALIRRRSVWRSLHGLQGVAQNVIQRLLPYQAPHHVHDAHLLHILAQHLAVERPDVVHLHRYDTLGLLGSSILRNLPRVYTEHGTPSLTWNYPYDGRQVNRADVVIAVSEQSAAAIRDVWACRRPVIVLPSMVRDPGEPEIRYDGSPTATFIGRVDENKNVIGLVRAFEHVVADLPEARLIVAGDGPALAPARCAARASSVGRSVHFCGAFKPDQLGKIMAETDVVVLFSHLEGLPIALIEAMAHGRPVVASDVGGVSELVEDGVTGLLVPDGDEDALARALSRLLSDTEMRQAMGLRARERYRRLGFTPERVAATVAGVYRQAIALHTAADAGAVSDPTTPPQWESAEMGRVGARSQR